MRKIEKLSSMLFLKEKRERNVSAKIQDVKGTKALKTSSPSSLFDKIKKKTSPGRRAFRLLMKQTDEEVRINHATRKKQGKTKTVASEASSMD